MDIEKIIAMADLYEKLCITTRRDFHKYAETAWTEFRTTSKIIEFLQGKDIPVKFGLDVVNPEFTWSYPEADVLDMHKQRAINQGANPKLVEKMQGYTGAMAIIDSGKPGPTFALRFDIDCNDVNEANDNQHRPYREGFASVNSNCMHACGHDGHAAIGLMLATILHEIKEQLCGKIKIIFQLGEEGDKGAQSMVERGILDDVDVLLSAHIFEAFGDYPAISGTQQGFYATTKFDVEIVGKSAHAGAAPEEGNHAIMAACMAIMNMNAFLQDSRGSTRLNIGTISGGTGRNVIPDKCFFRAETRGADTEVEQRLYHSSIGCIKAACDAFGCTYKIDKMGYGPTGSGDISFAEIITKAATMVPELKEIRLINNNTGGTDDFTYMMRRVQDKGGQACYMALHTKTMAGAHNDRFDFDETCLIAGVKTFLAVICHMIKEDIR